MRKLLLGSISFAMLVATNPTMANGMYHQPMVYKDAISLPLWTGLYGGLNAGWGWGSQKVRVSSPDVLGAAAITDGAIPSSIASDPNGFIGGVQLGYNYQWNCAVLGAEIDFQGADIDEHDTVNTAVTGYFPFTTFAKQQVETLGTVRARVGMLLTDPWLVYVTGGYAYGRTKLTGQITNPGCVGVCSYNSETEYRSGWTAGAGVEYQVGCNWSAKAEYLYYDLGSESINLADPRFTTTSQDMKVDFKGNVVRLGVNYKFM